MRLKVYDYRSDIVNMLVTPQIRCRFLKMAVGSSTPATPTTSATRYFSFCRGVRSSRSTGRARCSVRGRCVSP